MKASLYNHFIEIPGGRTILAYNAYSGAVAEIEKENYSAVKDILAHPEATYHGPASEFLQCLRGGGFLIGDGIDQTTALKVKARSDRLEGTILTLTVAPTLACNFNCDYCFESRSGIRMTEETQDALIAFSDRYLYRANALRLCWFGGEPTLCFSMIESLQNRFNELAVKHRIKQFPATIITNGFLMDGAMAQRLQQLGITHAQVTLDGPEVVHDRRRKLRNGRGTFQRIIDNLCAAAGVLDLTVRINIDKDNVDSAAEVVELLQQRDILDKVRITFAQITSSGSVCSDIIERCHDSEEFAGILTRLYSRLLTTGLKQVNFPGPSSGAVCGAIADGYFVVSPTGHLFKCWEDLSVDAHKSIGSIFTTEQTELQKQNLERYQAWQPLAFTECRDCRILPICMGGCPARGLEQTNPTHGSCASWKYNLREMLELAYSTTQTDSTGVQDSQ